MSSDPIELLSAISGFTLSQTDGQSAHQPVRIAVINSSYAASSFPGTNPTVRFEGESTVSGKRYKVVNGYLPQPGDRVVLLPVSGNNYVILGSIDSDALPYFGGSTGPDVQVFDTAGSHQWEKPLGMKRAWVRMVGGGGGAGGVTGAGSGLGTGGGGGSGAYVEAMIDAADLGATETVVIGSGGTGASNGTGSGTAGGDTTFNGMTAGGGSGGAGSTATTGDTSGGAGAGGTASGGNIANITGMRGQLNRSLDGRGVFTGMGGTSILGPGGSSSTSVSGDAPDNAGYGGGGGGAIASTTSRAGGNGGVGLAIIISFFV